MSQGYRYREEWLRAATERLRPLFARVDHPLPEAGRAAIGFTSKGAKGRIGECWASVASADKHFEIFIRPDKADPLEVLGILTHELCHAALPLGTGHGKEYKALALKVGLVGKMREAMPGPMLNDHLAEIARDLGELPHASLNIEFRETAPRAKQSTRMLKAWCEGVTTDGAHEACDYVVRLTAVHARKGAPICGVHQARMTIDWPAEDPDDGAGEPSEPA